MKMFERLVHQVLIGYIGKYIKDIHQDQIRVSTLKGEVLLEKAELALDAFDYLQLPFTITKGVIGKLSIKIPWKKFGRDPILIALEDVYICTQRRDDSEWSAEAVEVRELAGKRARLAAAELAKLSRRVSQSYAGISFISHVTAKILDNIQITIQNLHIKYADEAPDSPSTFTFGLALTKLTVITADTPDQSSTGSFAGLRLKGSQVIKSLEIQEIGLYWKSGRNHSHMQTCDTVQQGNVSNSSFTDSEKLNYILKPFNATISLVVSKSERFENSSPQYAISIDIHQLTLVLNDVQIYEMAMLWDYIFIYRLREKYGRFRPQTLSLLHRTSLGWKKAWWKYALSAVISDVRKRLRNTSWRNLGARLHAKRQYVQLYRLKLEHLHQDKPTADVDLKTLDDMENDLQTDEILKYRAIAESQLQKGGSLANAHDYEATSEKADLSLEGINNGDRISTSSRGWLNWLSLGMLGAGGTTDSSQFAGVITDEEIKDIFKATKYDPSVSEQGNVYMDHYYFLALSINVHEIITTLSSRVKDTAVMCLEIRGFSLSSKALQDSTNITMVLNSLKVTNPCIESLHYSHILSSKKNVNPNDLESSNTSNLNSTDWFLEIVIDMHANHSEHDVSVKVTVEPFEFLYDEVWVNGMADLFHMLSACKSHTDRVIISLNGFENAVARILSKAEYIFSNRKRIKFEVNIGNAAMVIPFNVQNSCSLRAALYVDSMYVGSKFIAGDFFKAERLYSRLKSMKNFDTCLNNHPSVNEFYDTFELKWSALKVKLESSKISSDAHFINISEAWMIFKKCILQDEIKMHQFKVYGSFPVTDIIITCEMLSALKEICKLNNVPVSVSNVPIDVKDLCSATVKEPRYEALIEFPSLSLKLLLENEYETSDQKLSVRMEITELLAECIHGAPEDTIRIGTKFIKMEALNFGQETTLTVLKTKDSLCSVTENTLLCDRLKPLCYETMKKRIDGQLSCLHFQLNKESNLEKPVIFVGLNHLEWHCYPNVVGMLYCFFNTSTVDTDTLKGAFAPEINIEKVSQDFNSILKQSSINGTNNRHARFPNASGLPFEQFPFISFCAFSKMEKVSKLNIEESHISENIDNVDTRVNFVDHEYQFELEINYTDIHFHDPDCVVAAIAIPKSLSLISFSLEKDDWDILSSIEGIKLISSFSPSWADKYVWGAVSNEELSVLNLRFTKKLLSKKNSKVEISASTQHSYCILCSDLLAMLIGYFDYCHWQKFLKPVSDLVNIVDSSNSDTCDTLFQWKVEVIDSILYLPVERVHNVIFLKLDMQELLFQFLQGYNFQNVAEGCNGNLSLTSSDSLKYNVMDFVCSQLSLSFRGPTSKVIKGDCISSPCFNTVDALIIRLLNGNLSIKVPLDSKGTKDCAVFPTRIAFNAKSFETDITEAGDSVDDAFQAITGISLELSSVVEYSQVFTTSAYQYFEAKESLKNTRIVVENPDGSVIQLTCCISKVSIKFHALLETVISSIGIIEAYEMDASCSFSNGLLKNVDVKALCMDLTASTACKLFRCYSNKEYQHGIRVQLSKLDNTNVEAFVIVQCIEIWLHTAWSDILMFYGTFANSKAVSSDTSPSPGQRKKAVSSSSLKLRSDAMIIRVLIPGLSNDESFLAGPNDYTQNAKFYDHSSELHEVTIDNDIFTTFPMHLSFCLSVSLEEVILSEERTTFKAKIKQIKGKTVLSSNEKVHVLPFCQITGVDIEGGISAEISEIPNISISTQVDTIDFWSSYPILCFWWNFRFLPFEKASSTSEISMSFNIELRKAVFLLFDGRWSCNAPIIEAFLRNVRAKINLTSETISTSFLIEMQINYYNIHKVTWEPFLEPWNVQVHVSRKIASGSLFRTLPVTTINVESLSGLDINITEALVQAAIRVNEMLKGVCDEAGLRFGRADEADTYYPIGYSDVRQYAPYLLQNDTGMMLNFWYTKSSLNAENNDCLNGEYQSAVDSGFAVPLVLEETPEELFQRWRPRQSADNIFDRKTSLSKHHMICFHFQGTTGLSVPLSMDLVGLWSLEVDFSNTSTSHRLLEQTKSAGVGLLESGIRTSNISKCMPVIFEVSTQQYSKLIRLYSTVVLLNATTVSLEVRFDIHIGIDPKIMDPILPGQEFPLPVHLAETGQIRFRPLGSIYLWSEAQSLRNILSQDNRQGLSRSFVCYPSHRTSNPFRCYMSLKETEVPVISGGKHSSCDLREFSSEKRYASDDLAGNLFSNKSRTTSIRHIILTAPLILNNCLPLPFNVLIENGTGISTRLTVPEGNSVSVFDFDSAHDLSIVINVAGYFSSTIKFSRLAVHVSEMDKGKGQNGKLLLIESLLLNPEAKGSLVNVKAEKTIHTASGCRELTLSVPFWLYNCSGIALIATDGDQNNTSDERFLPNVYSDFEQEQYLANTFSVGIASANVERNLGDEYRNTVERLNYTRYLIERHLPSCKIISPFCRKFSNTAVEDRLGHPITQTSNDKKKIRRDGSDKIFSDMQNLTKVQACLHSPSSGLQHAAEATLRLRIYQFKNETMAARSNWSEPFVLNFPNRSTTVVVPQPFSKGAVILSVSRTPVLGACSGKTIAVSFQPRYIIGNACSQDVCYKQRGTESFHRLHTGKHMNLHLADVERDFLVSIRFDESGWDWSGAFLPDQFGDTLVKMRNYVSGALQMVRVEVQNASELFEYSEILKSSDGSFGTYLVLLSDDDSGFMPYRIDNFSQERVRFYQQKCEKFENVVQPYTSCSYAWDEPCYPHRLVLEVPGEGVIGVYGLDEVKDYPPIQLSAMSEKAQQKVFISVHADGPVKVLTITSTILHTGLLEKSKGLDRFRRKSSEADRFEDNSDGLTDMITITIKLSFLGISIVDSTPQELVYASTRGIEVQFTQNVHQQKLIAQIKSIQLDNQLPHAVYPVIISTGNSTAPWLHEGRKIVSTIDSNHEQVQDHGNGASEFPAFYFSATKWCHMAPSIACFEGISIRLVPLCIEVEEQLVIHLVEYVKAISLLCMKGSSEAENPDELLVHHAMDKLNNGFLSHQNFGFVRNPYSKNMHFAKVTRSLNTCNYWLPLTTRVPVGAPWQTTLLLPRKKAKIYIENLTIEPIKLSISFSSTPWLSKDLINDAKQSLMWMSSLTLQRGIMAIVDIEGAPLYLRELSLTHSLASWDGIQSMVIRHYTRQVLHEWYKVLGSAGMFGNPMVFAKSLGFGIKDFISEPAKSIVQNPAGLALSMAHGTKSLFNNTVFAVSNAATQFSRAARKGVVAFSFDEDYVAEMGRRQLGQGHSSQGVVNEFLQGLTGLLQSPIKGVEKHGLPGIISGVAVGATGLIVRPMASILDVAGRTAQSIRNRSNPRLLNHFRVRFPRALVKGSQLIPYSWEEAVGFAFLLEADNQRVENEILVACKAMESPGHYVLLTKGLLLEVSNATVAAARLGQTVLPGESNWKIQFEIPIDDIMHVDREKHVLKVLAGSSQIHFTKPLDPKLSRQSNLTHSLPVSQKNLEFHEEDSAMEFLFLLELLMEEKRKYHPAHMLQRQHLSSRIGFQ